MSGGVLFCWRGGGECESSKRFDNKEMDIKLDEVESRRQVERMGVEEEVFASILYVGIVSIPDVEIYRQECEPNVIEIKDEIK